MRLRSAVKSFNSALSYARRMNPSAVQYMPDTVSYRQLRGEIQTARELNNVVNRLRRGGKAKAFKLVQNQAGSIVTKWQMREAQIAFTTRETRKAKERIRLGIQNAAGILTGNISTITERGLRPSKLTASKMNRVQMERIIDQEREATRANTYDRARAYYLNYTTALNEVGANNVGDGSAYTELLNALSLIMEKSPQTLVDMFNSNNEALQIEFIYDEFQVIETRMMYALDSVKSYAVRRGLL